MRAAVALGRSRYPQTKGLSHVAQVGEDMLPGPPFGPEGLHELPVDVVAPALGSSTLPQVHADIVSLGTEARVYTTSGFGPGIARRKAEKAPGRPLQLRISPESPPKRPKAPPLAPGIRLRNSRKSPRPLRLRKSG